jgi:hypothetical protein
MPLSRGFGYGAYSVGGAEVGVDEDQEAPVSSGASMPLRTPAVAGLHPVVAGIVMTHWPSTANGGGGDGGGLDGLRLGGD